MALDLGGRHAEAERGVRLAARACRTPTARGTRTTSATRSRTRRSTRTSPATSRPASGTTTSAPTTPRSCGSCWPMVERTIDYALAYQTETGEIAWRADDPADGALLTGSSSIHLSLRCAIAIAERLGHERPDWELSLGALAIAIAHRPERFLDKQRWAMDWYYPILGGVLRGQAAQLRIAALLGHVRGRRPRRALRVGPAVGDRGRDVRARDGARRDRRDRAGARAVRLGAVPPRRRRRLLVRDELRRTSASTRPASTSPPTTRRGTPRPSCSRRTRSATRARPRACSGARRSRPASAATSCCRPASRSKRERAALATRPARSHPTD